MITALSMLWPLMALASDREEGEDSPLRGAIAALLALEDYEGIIRILGPKQSLDFIIAYKRHSRLLVGGMSLIQWERTQLHKLIEKYIGAFGPIRLFWKGDIFTVLNVLPDRIYVDDSYDSVFVYYPKIQVMITGDFENDLTGAEAAGISCYDPPSSSEPSFFIDFINQFYGDKE
jgi:hypothetical protein